MSVAQLWRSSRRQAPVALCSKLKLTVAYQPLAWILHQAAISKRLSRHAVTPNLTSTASATASATIWNPATGQAAGGCDILRSGGVRRTNAVILRPARLGDDVQLFEYQSHLAVFGGDGRLRVLGPSFVGTRAGPHSDRDHDDRFAQSCRSRGRRSRGGDQPRTGRYGRRGISAQATGPAAPEECTPARSRGARLRFVARSAARAGR